MEKYIRGTSYNMIHLCIDRAEDYQISGVAYNNTMEEPFLFTDIHNLILKSDRIFDRNGNPQSSQIKRSFQKEESIYGYQMKPKLHCSYEDFLDKKGTVATLDIWVKSRRGSTWQGSMFYQDQEVEFRNILEFIEKLSDFLSL